jgi:hypothetical protein
MKKVTKPRIDQKIWLHRDDGRFYRGTVIAVENGLYGVAVHIGFWYDGNPDSPQAKVDCLEIDHGTVFVRNNKTPRPTSTIGRSR